MSQFFQPSELLIVGSGDHRDQNTTYPSIATSIMIEKSSGRILEDETEEEGGWRGKLIDCTNIVEYIEHENDHGGFGAIVLPTPIKPKLGHYLFVTLEDEWPQHLPEADIVEYLRKFLKQQTEKGDRLFKEHNGEPNQEAEKCYQNALFVAREPLVESDYEYFLRVYLAHGPDPHAHDLIQTLLRRSQTYELDAEKLKQHILQS